LDADLSPQQLDDSLHQVLSEVFGYSQFRGLQLDVCRRVSAGGDALVLMPTGAGKSLCFQVPALLRQRQGLGSTLVISPLIALMHDQVSALRELGVKAAYLNSSQSVDESAEIERGWLRGEYSLIYAAPERIMTPRFLGLMTSLVDRNQLGLFAIDEAHCVSQWGHDFRPEYRAVAVLHERFPSVPRVALTATADSLTRQDIVERLALEDAKLFVASFDRPNIQYRFTDKKEATRQLIDFIRREHPGDSGIVYALSRKRVEELSGALNEAGIESLIYHAGIDAAIRQKNQDRFLRADEQTPIVMVATIAFGMGIDKPDVRFVAHADLPKNIESYYQETGRAGRDGEPSTAWACYGLQDVVQQRRMIDESPAEDAFKQSLRGKLDALLALAESTECRRVHLLRYFGEPYAEDGLARYQCGNCDNCLTPGELWDATDAARMLLSAIYRLKQGGQSFGAGHIMDIVRGKSTEKVEQFGHASLPTFGVGAAFSEQQLRQVLRQLVAVGAVQVDANHYNTLVLNAPAKPILKGEQRVELRTLSSAKPERSKTKSSGKSAAKPSINLDAAGNARLVALKAWRTEVAKSHSVPAYVVFHDRTLEAIAELAPDDRAQLSGVTGMGAHKLSAYGDEILRVLRGV
jgi:ATP-dependent DNA helicase RecQ